MRNSIEKRIRITKNGKLIRRSSGQNHFRAKKTGKQIRNRRSSIAFTPIFARQMLESLKKLAKVHGHQ